MEEIMFLYVSILFESFENCVQKATLYVNFARILNKTLYTLHLINYNKMIQVFLCTYGSIIQIKKRI